VTSVVQTQGLRFQLLCVIMTPASVINPPNTNIPVIV
jgi:hypothetical protein